MWRYVAVAWAATLQVQTSKLEKTPIQLHNGTNLMVSMCGSIAWPTLSQRATSIVVVDRFRVDQTSTILTRIKWGGRKHERKERRFHNIPAALDLIHCDWVHYSYYYKSVRVLELLMLKSPLNLKLSKASLAEAQKADVSLAHFATDSHTESERGTWAEKYGRIAAVQGTTGCSFWYSTLDVAHF